MQHMHLIATDIKFRRPQESPADEDVKKLKDYTVQMIN